MFRRSQREATRERIDSQVEVLAAAVITALDAQGIDLQNAAWLLPRVEERIEQEIQERKARRLAEVEAGRAAWQREHGHIDVQALADLLDIDMRELPTAERLGFVHQLEWPPELRKPDEYGPHYWSGLYSADTSLSDDQRRRIAETALLAREEAADRLGITPARFDRLCQQAGLAPNIAGTYRLCDIEALREQAAALPPAQPSGKTQPIALWNALNARQRAYLQAIYEIDQQQEAYERGSYARGERSRPAAEWRQIEYGFLPGFPPVPSQLYEAIERLGLRDEGTGSTFNALEARKLITCHYPGRKADMSVVLTALGRRVVRAGIGELPPLRPSKDMLKDWAWKHLARLYGAGESGIAEYRFGFKTLDYLRGRNLISEQSGMVMLSTTGWQHYEEHWSMYRELYPQIDAPPPKESKDTQGHG